MNSLKGYPEVGKMFRAKDNVPNKYNKKMLTFERGEIVKVTGVISTEERFDDKRTEVGFSVERQNGQIKTVDFKRFGEFFERLS